MKKYLFLVLYSLGIILIGCLFSSILYYFNITNDKINNLLICLINIIAIFTSSFYLSENIKYKGLVTGLICFLIYVIPVILIKLSILNTNVSLGNILFYLVLLIFSEIGSIIGKNIKKENDAI